MKIQLKKKKENPNNKQITTEEITNETFNQYIITIQNH